MSYEGWAMRDVGLRDKGLGMRDAEHVEQGDQLDEPFVILANDTHDPSSLIP